MGIEGAQRRREGVFLKDGQWVVSLDGIHTLAVNRRLGAIIRMGLYASRKLPEIMKSTPHKELRDNKIYREHYAYNCHRTALEIQGETLDFYDASHNFKERIRDAFDNRNAVVTGISGVAGALQTGGFPRFVHIMNEREDVITHSTLVLGRDTGGTYVCFEKVGYHSDPFRLVSLEQTLSQYNDVTHAACIEPQEKRYAI